MKKFYSFLTIALVAVMSMTFTSCDEDHEIAFELDGTWEGVVYDRYNEKFYVDFRFYQDGFSTHGYGYEYDRSRHGDSYARFNWSVNNGNIYLNYNDGTRVVISNYRLGGGYLDGYLQETRSGWTKGDIHLTKVSHNPYDSGWLAKEQKFEDNPEE